MEHDFGVLIVQHRAFDWSLGNATTITHRTHLPAEEDVNVSMKASATWSQHSHSLIVVALVAVVEVGGGIEVGRVGVRAARGERVPSWVVGRRRRVMMISMRHSQQNCRPLQRHFNQLSLFAKIQLSTLSNCSKFPFRFVQIRCTRESIIARLIAPLKPTAIVAPPKKRIEEKSSSRERSAKPSYLCGFLQATEHSEHEWK